MSAANGDYGLTFETFVRRALDTEDVAHEGEEYSEVDALLTRSVASHSAGRAVRPAHHYAGRLSPGDRVACKVARYRISDGESTRRGRYWVPRCEVERCDAYAFGVYTEESGVLEGALAVMPTGHLREQLPEWVESPRRDIEKVCRPSWGLVFDAEEVSRLVE